MIHQVKSGSWPKKTRRRTVGIRNPSFSLKGVTQVFQHAVTHGTPLLHWLLQIRHRVIVLRPTVASVTGSGHCWGHASCLVRLLWSRGSASHSWRTKTSTGRRPSRWQVSSLLSKLFLVVSVLCSSPDCHRWYYGIPTCFPRCQSDNFDNSVMFLTDGWRKKKILVKAFSSGKFSPISGTDESLWYEGP